MKNAIDTTHHLDFLAKPYENHLTSEACEILGIKDDDPYDIPWVLFKVGTCHGQWRKTPDAYEILSVVNDDPGNGHLEDVLEWFYFSCKKSELPLRIRSFENEDFKQHLIQKRGFTEDGEDVVKAWEGME